MKVLFANFSPMAFDVETPEREPLGGTESCVAYLAVQLARECEVDLLGRTRAGVLRNVRHFDRSSTDLAELLRTNAYDAIVVASCQAALAEIPGLKALSPGSRIIFWNQQTPDDRTMTEFESTTATGSIANIVYVSAWQREITERRFGRRVASLVIGNGLAPAFESLFNDPAELARSKQTRMAYTSTPFRGLHVLLKSYARLPSKPILDVFSSMRVYQSDDSKFLSLYEAVRRTRFAYYHGSVSQLQLAQHMRQVSFLAYPSVYAETYCIAALEAMAAGATVVATDLGALPETTGGFGRLLRLEEGTNTTLAARYAELIADCLRERSVHPCEWSERMFQQVSAVNHHCTWRVRARQWRDLLRSASPGRVVS